MASIPISMVSGGDSRLSRALFIQSLTALATVILVAAPLAPVLWQSLVDRPLYEAGGLFTADNYIRLFGDSVFYSVVWNSVLLALATTLVACALGVAFAVFLERTNLPGRRVLKSLALWPMYISHLVIAFSWFIMYGPSGYFTLLSQQWLGGA
ncbi:MAG: hypothetical protein ACREB5_09455, partial [Sphingomonadaceae bacterium]